MSPQAEFKVLESRKGTQIKAVDTSLNAYESHEIFENTHEQSIFERIFQFTSHHDHSFILPDHQKVCKSKTSSV